jgi:ribosomal protein L11 methyltransferase
VTEVAKKFNFVLIHFGKETIHLAEALNAYAVEDFNCDGIEEFSLEESRVDEILGERAYSGGDVPESLLDEVEAATNSLDEVTYKYFFYQNDFEKSTEEFIFFIKDNFPDLPFTFAQKNFEDWNTEWRKFYSPIIVSDKLEIVPEWLIETRKNSPAQKVYIYPGMGFGTGTHETTFLCLKLFMEIEDKFIPEMTCLDFGCGSGILGIAALKLKSMPTVFCDIDRSALDNCMQNIDLNFNGENLSGSCLVLRERLQTTKYNLVFANILEQVLILEKEVLLSSLLDNGWLIVSGLLNHQVDSILNEYVGLKLIKTISKGDWSAVLFRNEK